MKTTKRIMILVLGGLLLVMSSATDLPAAERKVRLRVPGIT